MEENNYFYDNDVKRDEGYQYFLDRSDDNKQNKLAKKLADNHPLYGESLEDMLDKKEKAQRIEEIMDYLRDKIGDEWYDVLYAKYGERKSGSDIARERGTTPQNVNKKIKRAKRKAFYFLNRDKRQELAELNVTLCQLPSYLCQVPTLPFEKEMTRVTTPYLYEGKTHWHTKCEVPEYLKNAFHDCDIKCPLCFDKFGTSTCRNKKIN